MKWILSVLLLVLPFGTATAAGASGRTLFQPRDVVALVGGEDMVAVADYGFLEVLLLRERPLEKLKFRSLAKEGDTAFEQPRDFNYPALERQLSDSGATVVMIQLGQMESLRGKAGLPEFERNVDSLVERLGNGRQRRVVLVGPTPVFRGMPSAAHFGEVPAYGEAVRKVALRKEIPSVLPGGGVQFQRSSYRDGVHLNEEGHKEWALQLVESLLGKNEARKQWLEDLQLVQLVRSKNELWFHYTRPQNWAFLDGDRTVQPASRDHRDPEKRWFPEEMKAWLPLIASRETEIWNLVQARAMK